MIQYYMPQIQFYLALCSHETDKLIFSAIHGNDIQVSTIEYNHSYVMLLLDKMQDFGNILKEVLNQKTMIHLILIKMQSR